MEDKKYYVYVYLDPRNQGNFVYGEFSFNYQPIYVGKGTRNRLNQHLINVSKNKNSLFYNKLRKILNDGFEPIKYKLIESLTENESLIHEKKLINLIGRIDIETGTLCNMTEGGETGYKRTEESRKKLSEAKKGEKNPMYGKTTTIKQKECVKNLHKNGLIKLTTEGRKKLIENGKNRKGKTNSVIRSDVKTYLLISPDKNEYKILGAKKLQEFCKINKLQYHVLKNNQNIFISNKEIIGNRINAKNTIGWKMKLSNDEVTTDKNIFCIFA